jgi:DNA repair protein SbcD/Mre11
MRFMHIADIHLGNQQYGLKARFNDFSAVFLHLAEEAIQRRVDFVLLAGDLFEKRTVEPLAMRVAVAGLEMLRDAGIPVVAVEGNHERAFYQEQTSWMDFLDALGYLILLNPSFEGGTAHLAPHGPEGGGYVDLPDGVRVYGLKYYGSSTNKAVQSLATALADQNRNDVAFTIVMLHAGLEGQLAHMGRLSYGTVAALRPYADYVALGHIHKPYTIDDWIYNPGSPETCSMIEVNWPTRGYFIVDIDPQQDPKHHATLHAPERRPFFRFDVAVDALLSPADVTAQVEALIHRERHMVSMTPRPVIELTLTGKLPFNRYDLDLDVLQQLIETAWRPLTTRIRNLAVPAAFEIQIEAESSRPELERTIVRELLERDTRYRQHSEAWVSGALALKHLILTQSAPEAVIDHLRELHTKLAQAHDEPVDGVEA